MTTQLKFTPEIHKFLNYERYHFHIPLSMRRIKVLWLKSQRLVHEQIATLAGISENSMREYFSLYEDGGVEKIKEAQQKIKDITGIEWSETQIREFVKKNSIWVAGKSG